MNLYDEDRELLEEQGDKDFYIPALDEIMELGTYGYIKNSKAFKNLKRFMKRYMDVSPKIADDICGLIQLNINEGSDWQDILDMLNEAGLEPDDDEGYGEFITYKTFYKKRMKKYICNNVFLEFEEETC